MTDCFAHTVIYTRTHAHTHTHTHTNIHTHTLTHGMETVVEVVHDIVETAGHFLSVSLQISEYSGIKRRQRNPRITWGLTGERFTL